MWALHCWMEPVVQAFVAGPVNTWPLAVMLWFDRTQAAPGRCTAAVTVIGLPLPVPDVTPSMLAALSAEIACKGVIRCGRIHRRSEEHTSELQSQSNLVCRLLLE